MSESNVQQRSSAGWNAQLAGLHGKQVGFRCKGTTAGLGLRRISRIKSTYTEKETAVTTAMDKIG